jgi:hypothetical protein
LLSFSGGAGVPVPGPYEPAAAKPSYSEIRTPSSEYWKGDPKMNPFSLDMAKSALQKSIRRGEIQMAIMAANELFLAVADSGKMGLLERLRVIAVEDIGLAAAPLAQFVVSKVSDWINVEKELKKKKPSVSPHQQVTIDKIAALVWLMCLAPKTRVLSHLWSMYGKPAGLNLAKQAGFPDTYNYSEAENYGFSLPQFTPAELQVAHANFLQALPHARNPDVKSNKDFIKIVFQRALLFWKPGDDISLIRRGTSFFYRLVTGDLGAITQLAEYLYLASSSATPFAPRAAKGKKNPAEYVLFEMFGLLFSGSNPMVPNIMGQAYLDKHTIKNKLDKRETFKYPDERTYLLFLTVGWIFYPGTLPPMLDGNTIPPELFQITGQLTPILENGLYHLIYPSYAIDMHTRQGRKTKKGKSEFADEGSRVTNEDMSLRIPIAYEIYNRLLQA